MRRLRALSFSQIKTHTHPGLLFRLGLLLGEVLGSIAFALVAAGHVHESPFARPWSVVDGPWPIARQKEKGIRSFGH